MTKVVARHPVGVGRLPRPDSKDELERIIITLRPSEAAELERLAAELGTDAPILAGLFVRMALERMKGRETIRAALLALKR